MTDYILDFHHTNKSMLHLAGGKGANLGELSKIPGIHVPAGFCITTKVYTKVVSENAEFNSLTNELNHLTTDNKNEIRKIAAKIRNVIERIPIPAEIATQIVSYLDNEKAYAVRSSAIAEDLPNASFAGQQDTYLNIKGAVSVLQHISKCWASLYTERAIVYRMRHNFNHSIVLLSVVIQQMIDAEVSGIMFTADPVTSNRNVLSIDAGFGLGEALVAGTINADIYKIQNGEIVDKRIASKDRAIYTSTAGGTRETEVGENEKTKQSLTDNQALQLEAIGRKIEQYFNQPQDIEWCLADGLFYIVQSRPITTLFPIPETNDGENHVYISVGHQQMMTDPILPLGLSFYQLTAPRPMYTAGGRLFVDVAADLVSPVKRNMLVNVLGSSDPLIKDALLTILNRENFIKISEATEQPGNKPALDYQILKSYDPAIVDELTEQYEHSLAALKQNIKNKTGVALLDFIREDILELRKTITNTQSFGVIMTGMNAATWINQKMEEWLGEKKAADTLTQSIPNNITSEMGMELMNVADVIRLYPEVISFLQQVKHDDFLDELIAIPGGKQSKEVIADFLNKYGMRCAGEIDITKTRWSESPRILLPLILSNIKNFSHGAAKLKFNQGLEAALSKENDLLERLKQLPDGEEKAKETKEMISLVRNLAGYREYPKYANVNRYFVYKQALLKEAENLVLAGIINRKEDIYYLSFDELRELTETGQSDYTLINHRKEEYKRFEKLMPPRVMTSEGEVITGKYKHANVPANAIVGLPVSAGIVEGRARVITKMEDADLAPGDILVTRFTDPSWTPLFVAVKALITEVGGLMTHGAVIAREYGLPAVIGVERATERIKDGQFIRVNGTEGYIELL